jgi:hypothetical protein
MSRLKCEEVLPHLESYRRGDAPSELSLLVDDHLARCPECRRQLAHLKQVSAMLSAWRPRPVPAELLVETADAVSEGLGELGRHVFGRRREPTRRGNRRRPPPGRVQRLANTLALVALLFLAGAIVYRLWHGPEAEPPKPLPGGMCAVRLIRWDPPFGARTTGEASRALIADRRRQFINTLAELTTQTPKEAEAMLNRAPVTVRKDLPRQLADSIGSQLRLLGGRVEIIDGSGEPRNPTTPRHGPSESPATVP